MSMFEPVSLVVETFSQAYFMYKGMYEGTIEIRIEGRQSTVSGIAGTLFVRVYWNGHRMNGYVNPFKTRRTALKHAREMADSIRQLTHASIKDRWPKRSQYDSHMPIYRNWHADRDLPYIDYRRQRGLVIHPRAA